MSKWADAIYDESVKFTTPLPDKSLLTSLSKDASILDVGCGYGRTLNYLQGLGFKKLTGFDVSEGYVNKAKKDCPTGDIFVANFENFNLKNKYDLILLMGVIEYLLTDEEQGIFFEKISKSLSSNGSVLLETFIIDIKSNWKQYLSSYIKTFHWGRFKNSKGFECHHQSVGELKKILKKHFIIESSVEKNYSTWTDNTCRGYYFNLKKK